MSVRLILMRHGKSSWGDATLTDHQRPLNARGRKDAPAVARHLVELGWVPDFALVSDAARTEETWAWMCEEFPTRPGQVLLDELYHGTLEDISRALVYHATGLETVLALGHNPGWEEAVTALTGIPIGMTTANAALLEHGQAWPEALSRRDWQLAGVVRPKEL